MDTLKSNSNIKQVLITGGAGFIGSVATGYLLSKGYRVRVLDLFIFGEESISEFKKNPNYEYVKGDIRNEAILNKALEGVDAVIHLAAIAGAPESTRIPELTWDINLEGTKKITKIVTNKNIKRYLFVSTCSNYGASGVDKHVDETSKLDPISPYAESKVSAESYIQEFKESQINWTIYRLATVFGVSPRMRFDLLVNEFTREAFVKKKLTVFGNQGRTFVHIKDVARAFELFLNSPLEKINHKIFNVGSTKESNCTKGDLAKKVTSIIPGVTLELTVNDLDNRNYKVSFDKIHKELDYDITTTIVDGVKEIENYLALNKIDTYSDKYSNLNAYLTLNNESTRNN